MPLGGPPERMGEHVQSEAASWAQVVRANNIHSGSRHVEGAARPHGERPNPIWTEVETDERLVGLGESFRVAQAVETVIHAQVAPWLMGRDSRQIEAVSRHLMMPYRGFHSTSAEVRRQRRRHRGADGGTPHASR